MKPYKLPLLFSLLFSLSAIETKAALVDVSADTLQKWITVGTTFDFILIDIRDTSELASSAIIATEVCAPYHLSWRQGAFTGTLNKLPKDVHIFLYCASGNRSRTAGNLLVDSGYVSVYHLVGGYSGWGSRPTKPYSSVKPLSELPAPSMLKIAVSIVAQTVLPERSVTLQGKAGVIAVNAPLNQGHLLDFFDMQGRRVVRVQDPFKFSSRYALPGGLSGSAYVARLYGLGSRESAVVYSASGFTTCSTP
jgi:rhodanese-related sulfurtransferase